MSFMHHHSPLSALLLLLVLTACSTTSGVPEGDQLFIGLKPIAYTDPDTQHPDHFSATQEELEAALATAPNGALFGSSYYRTPFPYGLWIWNACHDSNGRLKKWLNKSFGKAPVLMSQINPALRSSVARSVLRKNGYMHADVTYSEVPQRNPKKMKIAYRVTADSLFTVDTLRYRGFPAAMQHLIDSARSDALISSGTPFTVSKLDGERSRISQLFRNNGYYYYQPSFASYLADTFQVAGHANLVLQLADSLPPAACRPWTIGRTKVLLRRSVREQPTDSLVRRYLTIAYAGKRPVLRPRVVIGSMSLRPRRLYSYEEYQKSVQKLNGSGVFSNVDLQLTPRTDGDTLDLQLTCTLDKPYDFYFETNVINRTIGRFGPEAKIGFTRRNIFRAAEKLDINLHGSYEWQTGGSSDDTNMDSYQYGADAAIEFPRILFPKFHKSRLVRPSTDAASRQRRRLPRRYFTTPWTVAKVSSDVVRRPGYYKMHVVSGEWTYRWQPYESHRHELSPLTLKYQFMNSHTQRFDDLMIENPYLLASMSDYFIPKMRYTYTYASPTTLRHPVRWETTVEESGNVTALYDVIVQGNGWNQKEKTLFKNPYSQYLKVETDFTKTWTLSTQTQLVGHFNAGYVWSYGNSTEAPFSELFYVGGANSVRAFPVRSIGPGAFKGMHSSNRQMSYLLQNGNMKLVANLELRHRLVGNLYGALFLDAGNVWSDADYTLSADNEEDASEVELVNAWNDAYGNTGLRLRSFLRQIATGTGIGLRYDLDFLILRVDWGLGFHLPYHTNRSSYFNISRFRDMHTLHIAIGYPF